MRIRSLAVLLFLLARTVCWHPLSALAAAPEASSAPVPEALPSCVRPRMMVNRAWMLFFDRHSADLGDRARRSLDGLVAAQRRGDYLLVLLRGFLDASETGPEDSGLARRRAEAATDYLAQQGIGREQAWAEASEVNGQLVPTDPGVPEPQNRRVEMHPIGIDGAAARVERQRCVAWVRQTCIGKGQVSPQCNTALDRLGNDEFP